MPYRRSFFSFGNMLYYYIIICAAEAFCSAVRVKEAIASMSWLFFAVICLLGWGGADYFYKLGSGTEDRLSHLKLAVWVGLVMGVSALVLLPFTESGFHVKDLPGAMLAYAPASLSYIVSMVIGYAGLRYLELSIVSPVQNASGGFSALCMLGYFLLSGKITSVGEALSGVEMVGTGLTVLGVVGLAVAEQRLSAREAGREGKAYRFGARALLFPLLYCLFDTVGTAADGVILDSGVGAGFGEIDVLVLYGLTFFLFGLGAFIYIRLKTGDFYRPFRKGERYRAFAAVAEEFGQIFYVFAMAKNPVLAAPVVASYCIVSVLLSRLLLKEKLTRGQYACIFPVLIGIVLLGLVP